MALPEAASDSSPSAASNLLSGDRCTPALGMHLLEVSAGGAKVRMRVRSDMVNGFGTCHGGMIFSLADSAFAFACNSRGVDTVAQSCSIDYLRPVPPGDELVAEASEEVLGGRTGVYRVRVLNQHGQTVAFFRGLSRQAGGSLVPSLPPS